jgi:hypothetical protein
MIFGKLLYNVKRSSHYKDFHQIVKLVVSYHQSLIWGYFIINQIKFLCILMVSWQQHKVKVLRFVAHNNNLVQMNGKLRVI